MQDMKYLLVILAIREDAMRYAIVINIDYETYYHEDCRFVWKKIREGMIEAGFVSDHRLFTINAKSEEEACELARKVIDRLNRSREIHGIDIYSYLKEFYGYDHSEAVNLLVPATEHIQVEMR
jgi:hypothetical protein